MSDEWENIQELPSAGPGELHVWRIKIDPGVESIVSRHLSADEIKRASSLTRPSRRSEFIVSRGALRGLLAGYLGDPPASLDIVYSKDGKPAVKKPGCPLKFNVSHSGDILLIAFSHQAEVGVDVERIDSDSLEDGTISRSLHPAEMKVFRDLKDDEGRQYFFECWTRKEAFLKLLGCGFAIEPAEIDLTRNGPDTYGEGKDKVYFTDLPTIQGYCSSVATDARPVRARFYTPASSILG